MSAKESRPCSPPRRDCEIAARQCNNANPTIQELAGNFGAQGLIGKSQINITDMNCDDRAALSRACSWLNAISGEDDVSVQRKNKESWNGRLPGRVTILTNGLPNFGSGTPALARRLMVLIFSHSVTNPDARLTEKLAEELTGILNWSLDGLARLDTRGHFIEPEASAAAKIKVLHRADPLRGFIDECCTLDPQAETDKDLFYVKYRNFAIEAGNVPMAKRQPFGRSLRARSSSRNCRSLAISVLGHLRPTPLPFSLRFAGA